MLTLAVAVSLTSFALATGQTDLRAAIAAYDAADLERSEVLFRRLDPAQLTPKEQALRQLYLGVLLLRDERPQEAEDAFYALLELDPWYRPDEKLFSPDVVAAFSGAKARLVEKKFVAALEALVGKKPKEAYDLLTFLLLLNPQHAKAQSYLRHAESFLTTDPGPRPAGGHFALRRLSSTRYDIARSTPQTSAYLDRCYVIAQIPTTFQDLTLLQTANDDKQRVERLVLEVNQPVEIVVAYDQRARVMPAWLAPFTNTGEHIVLTKQQKKSAPGGKPCPVSTLAEEAPASFSYLLYKQQVGAGVITLGPNMTGSSTESYNMYFVLLRSLSTVKPSG